MIPTWNMDRTLLTNRIMKNIKQEVEKKMTSILQNIFLNHTYQIYNYQKYSDEERLYPGI